MSDNEKLETYTAYLDETWFDETWFDGHFRPHMWNYYRHCGPKTNNHLDNRKKKISWKAHLEQAASEVIILQLEAGGARRQKGEGWLKEDRR